MFHSGKSYLVEESLGIQWYFTLTGQQTIEYSKRTDKVWTKPRQLEGLPIKHYCVTIDKNDNLYLFAYNTSKQLISYKWVDGQWNQQIVYSITSRFETISTLEALTSPTQIHLFYYIENSLKRAQEYLIHSRLYYVEWNRQVLMSFLTGQEGAPHMVRCDEDGNLFCVYTRRIQNQTRCYYVYYNNHEESWSKPAILFQKPGKCSEFSGQTDAAGCLHMVWKEDDDSLFRINYRIIDPWKKNSASEIVCIQEDGVALQSPCLHIGDKYYCFWLQEEKGMVSQGDPLSKQWDEPFMATEEPVTTYEKISATLDGRAQPFPQMGDGYPHFDWTLETLYLGSKPEPKSKKPDTENHSGSFEQDMEILQPQITEIQNRLDEFYTALYQLQEYIRQKDKSSFHTEARIRKLTFELDQLRSIKAKIPQKGISNQKSPGAEVDHIELESPKMESSDIYSEQAVNKEQPVQESGFLTKDETLEEKRTPMKNIDRGSGELQLGNVNILINPEDNSEDI